MTTGRAIKSNKKPIEKSFGERYARFCGAIKNLPNDLASQHEHYRLKILKRKHESNNQ